MVMTPARQQNTLTGVESLSGDCQESSMVLDGVIADIEEAWNALGSFSCGQTGWTEREPLVFARMISPL